MGEETDPLGKGLLEQSNDSERMEIASLCSFCDKAMKKRLEFSTRDWLVRSLPSRALHHYLKRQRAFIDPRLLWLCALHQAVLSFCYFPRKQVLINQLMAVIFNTLQHKHILAPFESFIPDSCASPKRTLWKIPSCPSRQALRRAFGTIPAWISRMQGLWM